MENEGVLPRILIVNLQDNVFLKKRSKEGKEPQIGLQTTEKKFEKFCKEKPQRSTNFPFSYQ